MVRESEERQPIEWFADQLIPFLELLRCDGYNIGIRDYISVYNLLLRLSAIGQLDNDLRPVGRYLAPLICSTADELQDFKQRYESWVEWQQPPPKTDHKAKLKEAEAVADLDKTAKGSRRWIWLMSAIGLITVFSVIWYNASSWVGISISPAQKIDPGGVQPASDLLIFYFWPIICALGTIVIIWFLWWRRQVNIYLQNRRNPEKPYLESLPVQRSESPLFRSIKFLRTSQALRRRYRIESRNLNMPATIEKTIRYGGLFSPVQGFRQISPEYLILIDRSTFLDHQTFYIDELVDRLEHNDVFLSRYYFFKDPRLCYPVDQDQDPMMLHQLAVRHPNQRLLIFSNGKGMVDGVTGMAPDWIALFAPWTHRAIMPLETKNNRIALESALSQAGFMVLPASDDGMSAYIQKIQLDRFPPADTQDLGGRFPEIIHRLPEHWTDRNEPAPELVATLLDQLRLFLGNEGFEWLAACAVYPEVRYELTMLLGERITHRNDRPLFSEPTLRALAQLPWFGQGHMPDWLRRRLISQLSAQRELEIRNLLYALLLTALEEDGEKFELTYAKIKEKGLQSFQKQVFNKLRSQSQRRGPLSDHIFVTFMENPLSVRVPKELQQSLRASAVRGRRLSVPRAADQLDRFKKLGIGPAIGFIITGLLASVIYIRTDFLFFSGQPLQILLACVVGYRYGPRNGMIAGALLFLPNLIFYVALPNAIDNRTIFEGYILLESGLGLQAISPIGYLLHAGLGFAASLFKVAVPPPRLQSRPSSSLMFLLLIPIYIFGYWLKVSDLMGINLRGLTGIVFLAIAFHFGFKRSFGLLLGYLPIAFGQYNFGPTAYGGAVDGPELLLILMSTCIASSFPVRLKTKLGVKSILYAVMLITACSMSFQWMLTEEFRIHGYPIALGIVFAIGYLFGTRRGFGFGLSWAIAATIIRFHITYTLSFGSEGYFATLAAPIIGYLAGNLQVSRNSEVFSAIARIFAGLYSLGILISLLNGATNMQIYLEKPIYWLMSLMTAIVMVALFKRLRLEEVEEEVIPQVEAEPSDLLFKPAKKLAFVGMIFSGWFALGRYEVGLISVNLDLLQFIIVFLIGHTYGKRPALISGILVFLPNLILYYIGESDPQNFLFGQVGNGEVQIDALSVIGYLLFASMGYAAAVLKLRLMPRAPTTPRPTKILPLFILLLYITALRIALTEILRLNLNDLIYPIMLSIAFYYGFKKAKTAFWYCLPLLLFSVPIGFIQFGNRMHGIHVTALLFGLAIAVILGSRPVESRDTKRTGAYYRWLFFAIISTFDFTLSPLIRFPGYALAFGIIFVAGYRFGPRQGFKFGIIWSIFACVISFQFTDAIRFGGIWWFPLLAAPILGYAGGHHYQVGLFGIRFPQQITSKQISWTQVVMIFTITYALEAFIMVMTGNFNMITYAQLPLFWIQSVIMAIIFLVFWNTDQNIPNIISRSKH